MNIRRSGITTITFAFLAAICSVRTEAQIAFDAHVELLPGGDITSPGGVSKWRLTIMNNGNEPIFTPAAGTEFIEYGPGRTFHLYGLPETAPCFINYTDWWFPQTQQVGLSAAIFFGDDPLAPNASTSCIVEVVIDPEAPPVFTMDIPFVAHNKDFSVTEREFIPITFVLSTLSKPIPTLSSWGLAATIAGLFFFAALSLKTVKP